MTGSVRRGLLLLAACGSYVPQPVRFTPARGTPTLAPIAASAITVRAHSQVMAAGGRYLGILVVEGSGLRKAIRDASTAAAERGGTHIQLRSAEVTEGGERSVSLIGDQREASSIRFVPSRQADHAHVVFEVFRVEPDHWALLHPQMRPASRLP